MCISRQDLEESRQGRDGHTMDRRPAGLEGRLLLRIEGIKRAPVLRLSEIRADEAIADHGRSNYICTESDSNLQITSVGAVQIEAVRHLAIGRVGTYSANSHGAVNHVFLPSFSKRASSALYMSTMDSPSSGTGLRRSHRQGVYQSNQTLLLEWPVPAHLVFQSAEVLDEDLALRNPRLVFGYLIIDCIADVQILDRGIVVGAIYGIYDAREDYGPSLDDCLIARGVLLGQPVNWVRRRRSMSTDEKLWFAQTEG